MRRRNGQLFGSLTKVLFVLAVLVAACANAPAEVGAQPVAAPPVAPKAPADAEKPVVAPKPIEAPEATEGVAVEGDKITVDYKDKPIAEIARRFSKISKKNIIVDEGIFDRVTFNLTNPVQWREALNLILDQIGCEVAEEGNTLKIIRRPEIGFRIEDQDIKSVLFGIAKTSGQNVVVEGDITGKVSLNLADVNWRAALYAVAKSGGYIVVEEEAGGKTIYRITSKARLKEQIETKIFQLNFIRPPEDYEPFIDSDVAKQRKTAAGDKKDGQVVDVFALTKALEGVMSENGSLHYDSTTNSFIVQDIKPKLDAIDAIIKKVDVEPVQIAIEVKFVLTANTDLFDVGVNWKNGFAASLTGGSTLSRFPFNLGSFGLQGFQIFRSGHPNNTPRAGATGIGSGSDFGAAMDPDQDGEFDTRPFNLGTLDFSSMKLILQMIKSDTQSEIVQEPRLLTLDNKTATIFVGQTTHYAETYAASNQSGGLTYSLVEAAKSPVRTGFQLFFIPHVVPGTNRVYMTVIPEAATLIGTTSTAVAGFTAFTTKASETTTQVLTIDLPTIQTQSLMTTMMLESGQTAVIGGLITNRETEGVSKVPFLGDIPFLGWLFRNETRNVQKQNLLIFMTPHVIRRPVEELTPLYEKYLNEQQKLFPWKYEKTDEARREAGRWLPRPKALQESDLQSQAKPVEPATSD